MALSEWRLLEQTFGRFSTDGAKAIGRSRKLGSRRACDLEDDANRGSQDLEIDEFYFLRALWIRILF